MDSVTAWAAGICLCTIVCAVLDMITPNGGTEKTVRFVLGLFMVCAVVVPLADFSFDWNEITAEEQYEANTDLKEDIQNQGIQIVERELEQMIADTAEPFGAVPEKTEINTDIDNENRISIVSVTVILNGKDAEKAIQIKNAVESELGIVCDTVISKNQTTGS